MTPPIQPSTAAFPLRLGAPEDFARVASLLRSAPYDSEGVCRALQVARVAEIGVAIQDSARLAASGEWPLVGLLIRLFLAHEDVPAAEVERLVDPPTIASLLALDLLRRRTGREGATYAAAVLLCPVAGFLAASDRGESFGTVGPAPIADVVFPALYHGTLRFLGLLPTGHGDVVDLCAGSGIGALVLSRSAKRAVAADITPRSAHFARFNARLNGCSNVEVAEGDLYDAVKGQTFDLVVAHPPYVPAESTTQIYRDGGITGEAILRRIIEGLPSVLRPHGALYMVGAGWDTQAASFEERVRSWLGQSAGDFDVVFALLQETPASIIVENLAERMADAEAFERWRVAFEQERLERHVYGALVLHRGGPESRGPTITRRTRLSSATTGAAFPWLMDRLRWRGAQERAATLATTLAPARPRLEPHTRVRVRYEPGPESVEPKYVALETDRPFGAQIMLDPWMLELVAKFDGRSVDDVFRTTRTVPGVPADFRFEHLTKLVAMGLEHGFWAVDLAAATGAVGPRSVVEGEHGDSSS
jgi:SAM-dependent methyltransferase